MQNMKYIVPALKMFNSKSKVAIQAIKALKQEMNDSSIAL